MMGKERISNQLPIGWELISLEEISLPIERVNREYQNQTEKFKYIDIEAIDNVKFRLKEPKTYTWTNAPSRAQQLVKAGDILFATVRPYLKNISIIPQQYDDLVASTGFCVIRPLIVNPKFVFYYVLSQPFIDSVNRFAKGTSYPAISSRIVLEQKIPLPPLSEQHRIVAKIEEQLSELENAEQSLKKAQRELIVYRHSILKNAFNGTLTSEWRKGKDIDNATKIIQEIKLKRHSIYHTLLGKWEKEIIRWKNSNKKIKAPVKPKPDKLIIPLNGQEKQSLPKIPSSWVWGKTAEVADIIMGQSPEGNTYNTIGKGMPLINGPVEFGPTPFSYTVKSKWTTAPTKICEEGDLIICVRGSTTGRQNIAGFQACLGRGVAAIKTIVSSPKYIYHYFDYSREKLFEMGTGTTFPSISLDQLESFPIPVCSDLEQNQIVQEIEYHFTIVENLEKTIQNDLKRTEIFRQDIIKRAFEGKLVDRDSDNETASELILKIKKEKDQYLISQSEITKQKPKKVKPMEINKSIIEVLEEAQKPIGARDLWLASEYKNDIDKFYSALKIHLEKNEVIELSRKGKESLLTLKKGK